MSSLLIIGNGFDLHHNMKTKYWDYREFLLKNGKGDIVEAFEQRDESNKKYLWNELERQIGLVPYENAYCYLVNYADENWSDSYHHDFQYEIKKMMKYWPGIKDYLKGWICSIEYTSPDKNIFDFIKKADCFLSFNYTNTLENLYGIDKDKITYIHGDFSIDDELILGHQNDDWYPEWDRNNHDEDVRLLEASEMMDEHLKATIKDVNSIMIKNKKFFNSCDHFDEIYVIGLSYNETDKPYLIKIAEMNNKASWFFNWHTDDDFLAIDNYAKSIGLDWYKKINITKGLMG